MWCLVLKLAVEGLGTQESFNESILTLKANLEPHLRQLLLQGGAPDTTHNEILYPYHFQASQGDGSDVEIEIEGSREGMEVPEAMGSKSNESQGQGVQNVREQDAPEDERGEGDGVQGTSGETSDKAPAPQESDDANDGGENKRCSQRLADKVTSGNTTKPPSGKDLDTRGGSGERSRRSRSRIRSKAPNVRQVVGNSTAKNRAGMGYKKTRSGSRSGEDKETNEGETEEESDSEAGEPDTDGERFEEVSGGEGVESATARIAQKMHHLQVSSPKRFGDIMNNTRIPMKRRVQLLARALGEPARKKAKLELGEREEKPIVPEVNVSSLLSIPALCINRQPQWLKTLKQRGFVTEPGNDNKEIPFEMKLPLPLVGTGGKPKYHEVFCTLRNHPRLVRQSSVLVKQWN